MTIRLHETDYNGKPVAFTGEYFHGKTAADIVDAMKKNPFQIGLTRQQYMQSVLDKIGKFTLTEEDAELEFLNILAKHNYATFEEEPAGGKK